MSNNNDLKISRISRGPASDSLSDSDKEFAAQISLVSSERVKKLPEFRGRRTRTINVKQQQQHYFIAHQLVKKLVLLVAGELGQKQQQHLIQITRVKCERRCACTCPLHRLSESAQSQHDAAEAAAGQFGF